MAEEKNRENLTQTEHLIERMDVASFQSKPQGRRGMDVVVLEKIGNRGYRHVATLRPDQPMLTFSERLWGNYACYLVDTRRRQLLVEDIFRTHDKVSTIRVGVSIEYRVIDSERVVMEVEDPLGALRIHVLATMRREIAEIPLEKLNQVAVEKIVGNITYDEDTGIKVEGAHVIKYEMDEKLADYLRKLRDRQLAWTDEDKELERKNATEDAEFKRLEELLKRLGLQDSHLARLFIQSKQPDIGRLTELALEYEKNKFDAQGEYIDKQQERDQQLLRLMIEKGFVDEKDVSELIKGLAERMKQPVQPPSIATVLPRIMFSPPAGQLEPSSGDKTVNETNPEQKTSDRIKFGKQSDTEKTESPQPE
jgi:hypothetical protein